MKSSKCRAIKASGSGGFTLLELMVVMVIMAIAAAIAVPMFSGAGTIEVEAAGHVVAADLEYARSLAISRQQTYSVVFNAAGESYQVVDSGGTVVTHPINVGDNYIVNFSTDTRLDQVDITSADFDSTSTVKFDYLGSAFNGNSQPLSSGVITLQSQGRTVTVNVEPITGYITVSD